MNIGITCYPVIGGSGIIATELGMMLAARGHQVHFISYDMPYRFDRYQENVFFHQVEISSYPLFKYPPYTLSLAAKMAEVGCRYKLDILHVHYAIPHATAAFLAKQFADNCRIKVVTTLHGTDITLVGSDRSFYEITKFSVAASDGVTAVSDFLLKKVRDVFHIKNNIKVIHNFINTDQFTPQDSVCPKKTFNADGHKIVMHLSNFRPVKRINDVMDTFNIIHKQVKSKLVMIGEGPEFIFAENYVKEHNLTEDVVFMGNQSSVEKILPCADLFLLPTKEESFGLAALEAMSCGVPVIGTNSGGLPELVTHNVNGYLYDVGDVESMGNMGVELLQDEQRLSSMKKAARDTALNKFASQDIVQQYEDYYFSIITKKEQIK